MSADTCCSSALSQRCCARVLSGADQLIDPSCCAVQGQADATWIFIGWYGRQLTHLRKHLNACALCTLVEPPMRQPGACWTTGRAWRRLGRAWGSTSSVWRIFRYRTAMRRCWWLRQTRSGTQQDPNPDLANVPVARRDWPEMWPSSPMTQPCSMVFKVKNRVVCTWCCCLRSAI